MLLCLGCCSLGATPPKHKQGRLLLKNEGGKGLISAPSKRNMVQKRGRICWALKYPKIGSSNKKSFKLMGKYGKQTYLLC